MVPTLEPLTEYRNFGCPHCGYVVQLPAGEGERGPWCMCYPPVYRWVEPRHTRMRWTQMVEVEVKTTNAAQRED